MVQREPVRDVTTTLEPVAVRDRVRWGPVIAGFLMAIGVLLLLSLLGVAFGMTIFDVTDAGSRTVGTGAAIWGAITLVLAFFVGGWTAGWTAGVPTKTDGLVNGLLVGVVSIAALLWLIGSGLGYLLGAVSANLQLIAEIGRDLTAGDIDAAAAQAAFEDARVGIWATLLGMLLALGAASLGGWLGWSSGTVGTAPARRRV